MGKQRKAGQEIGEKVVLLKTGWSDFYKGGPIEGNFGYVKKHGPASGHEKYNFAPFKGEYRGYCPPHRPAPDERTGWTVIWVAKKPGTPGVRIVGVYYNATFLDDYQPYRQGSEEILYCVAARAAMAVPPKLRSVAFRSPVKSGSCCYLRSPKVPASRYGRLLRQMSGFIQRIQALPTSERDRESELPDFPSSEHRTKVERAAVAHITRVYRARGYQIADLQKRRDLGYDLQATRNGKSLKLEVKGTAGDVKYAYVTANEWLVANQDRDDAWVFCLVTNALVKPTLSEYRRERFFRTFAFDPVCYRVTEKRTP